MDKSSIFLPLFLFLKENCALLGCGKRGEESSEENELSKHQIFSPFFLNAFHSLYISALLTSKYKSISNEDKIYKMMKGKVEKVEKEGKRRGKGRGKRRGKGNEKGAPGISV